MSIFCSLIREDGSIFHFQSTVKILESASQLPYRHIARQCVLLSELHNETKWIVVPCDEDGAIRKDADIPNDDEIYAQIAFQEQFFCGVLVR